MKGKYQCVRHRWYPSKEMAEEKLIDANKKYNILLTRVYKCNWCLGWHLTSK